MDDLSWFDSYDGPKLLTSGPEGAKCWIGYNAFGFEGRAVGKDITTDAPTLWEAIAEARQLYESIPDSLSTCDVAVAARHDRAN
jgi:hypothetical protein